MYSLIPDDIVAELDGRKVFAIEVQKSTVRPNTKDIVFGDENIGHQVWMYLMAIKHMGVARPLRAIMTFNAIQRVSLDDIDHLNNKGDRVARCKEAKADLNSFWQRHVDIEGTKASKQDQELSPLKESAKVCDTNTSIVAHFKRK